MSSSATAAADAAESSSTDNLIMVVGSANQDLTSDTDTLPVLGETVMGKDFRTSCGGKGANQAVAAACLNLAPVTMLCRVGDDVFGQSLLQNFSTSGVSYDEKTTVLKDTSSGVASIVVDDKSGDNMIIVSPGANYKLTKEDVRKEIASSKPSFVVAQLEILPEVALESMKAGKEVGACTIMNPAPAPDGWSFEEFFPHIDILIPNETELRKMCPGCAQDDSEEKLAKQLFEKGVGQAVVVTMGSRGCLVVEKDGNGNMQSSMVDAPEELPARKEPVVDTIGAGDAFCGALASYLSRGVELTDATKYACGVASMTVRKPGAQTSYPTYNDLPACLQTLKGQDEKRVKQSKPIITFVTGNKNKLKEVRQILGVDADELPYEITNCKVDLPELQGDAIDIAKDKCRQAAEKVDDAVFVEDTQLCFNALDGMPGPYIRHFLEKCGHEGLNKMLDGFDDRSAYAQTIVAYTTGPGAQVHVFDGRTDGTIVQPRGSLDFGWDPIFEPKEGEGKTYAEMTKEAKNKISHRGRSFAKFKDFLKNS